MKALSVGREDAGRVIEPRKRSLVEMADSVRPQGKQYHLERLRVGLDDISGVPEQGMYQKFIWETCESLMALRKKYSWTSVQARKRKWSLRSQMDHSTDEADECR